MDEHQIILSASGQTDILLQACVLWMIPETHKKG